MAQIDQICMLFCYDKSNLVNVALHSAVILRLLNNGLPLF